MSTYVWWKEKKSVFLYKEKKKVFSLRINVQKDWLRDHTFWAPCGTKMKIKSVPKYFWSFVLNFTAPRYTILFLNSKIYIMHVINHEWNKSMFVASVVCFVWDTKPDFPTIGIRARFSSHDCIACDWSLE